MNAIKAIILAVIGVYIGIALVPGLNTTLATITYPTYSQGVVGMASIILIVVFAMLVFMVVRAMTEQA